jgi:2-polyprenyl-3-methyl-5-hydroxy-6-metoxy-1,4-benzoquinol methylase
MSVPAACPLCNATAEKQSVVVSQVYGDNGERAVFRCGQCDVRYLYPGLSAAEQERLYSAEFESFMAKRSGAGDDWDGPEKHIRANEQQRQRRMRHLSEFIKPGSRILEVGCGSGFMLYPLMADGHQCVAVEPSGVFSDYVRGRGLSCHRALSDIVAAGDAAEGFDLILHYYVLEHVADPVGFLRSQLALLRPGGRIVFEVPNANDALTKLYQIAAYERFIWVVSHSWYFTERSLDRAISMTRGRGRICLDQRYDLSNHLVWARDGKPGGMGRFTAILGQELEDQYRAALVRARLCDTLIGIVER